MSWDIEETSKIASKDDPPRLYHSTSSTSSSEIPEKIEDDPDLGPPPKDKWGIVYIIILINGIGVLLPWNMFITIAPDYYVNFWFSPCANGTSGSDCTKVEDHYGRSFMSAMGITAQIPNFLMALVSVSQIIKGPMLWRIMGSLVVNCLLVSVILVLVIVQQPSPSAENWFYIVSLIIVMAMNASNGLYQNSMFGLAADFPGKYTNALVFGNNICGTFTSLLAILTTIAFKDDTKTVALLYFSISLATLVLCIVTILLVTRFDLFKYYVKVGEKARADELARRPDQSHLSLWERFVEALGVYWETIKHCWPQFLNIFLTFFVSLAIFPTILVGITPIHDYGKTTMGNIYYALTVFLNFNFFAAVGNFCAGLIQFPSRKFLFIPVFARLLFIPYFMFCEYDMDNRHMPVFFKSAWFFIIANVVMSFTSGYFSSLGMMYAPGSAPPHLQKVAGQIAALCLVGGIMAGVGFTPAITSMVDNIGSSHYSSHSS